MLLDDIIDEARLPTKPTDLEDQERLARLDTLLSGLWSPKPGDALEFASSLYAQEGDDDLARPIVEQLGARFQNLLTASEPRMPVTFGARYQAATAVAWRLLRAVRKAVSAPFVEEYLAIALRPVRRQHMSVLAPEVCAILYDFYRGIWTPHLTKPQLYVIDQALAITIAALPPGDMAAFWTRMQSQDALERGAMLLGLKYLCSAHAVSHLLYGLEYSSEHTTRAAIVDCLEQIAEPGAIAPMLRLRRETAATDWTLSRQIARAVRVIEQQNRGQQHRTLLRPALTPPDSERSLLRPGNPPGEVQDLSLLLRPAANEKNVQDDSAT